MNFSFLFIRISCKIFLRHDQNVNAMKGQTHVFMRSRISDVLLLYIKGMMLLFYTNQLDIHIYLGKAQRLIIGFSDTIKKASDISNNRIMNNIIINLSKTVQCKKAPGNAILCFLFFSNRKR